MKVSAVSFKYVLDAIVNRVPAPYDALRIGIAKYTAAQEFIARAAYYVLPTTINIPPECCYVYILMVAQINGQDQPISSVPIDNDDAQLNVNDI